MDLPKTRAEAIARGLTRYFTGEPCKHGHVAERNAIDGQCRECSRNKRAELAINLKKNRAADRYTKDIQSSHSPPRTRSEAIKRGRSRYFPGRPCKSGHVAEYNIYSGCVECTAHRYNEWKEGKEDELQAYKAQWYQENRQDQKEKKKNRYLENIDQERAIRAEYRRNNPEKVRQQNASWRKRYAEKKQAMDAEYRKKNRDKIRTVYVRWRAENRERANAIWAARRARKLKATPAWLTDEHKEKIVSIYEQAALAEQLTGIKHHVDHIEPLQGKDRCGLHVPWNLQVLEARENISKGNRTHAVLR